MPLKPFSLRVKKLHAPKRRGAMGKQLKIRRIK